MKRIGLWVLLGLLIASVAGADPGVQVDQNVGFLNLATPTFDIGTSTATNIGALIPAGARGFELTVFGGDVIVGNTNDLATGPHWVGHKIASGTSMTWSGKDVGVSFAIHGKCTGASPCSGTLCAW